MTEFRDGDSVAGDLVRALLDEVEPPPAADDFFLKLRQRLFDEGLTQELVAGDGLGGSGWGCVQVHELMAVHSPSTCGDLVREAYGALFPEAWTASLALRMHGGSPGVGHWVVHVGLSGRPGRAEHAAMGPACERSQRWRVVARSSEPSEMYYDYDSADPTLHRPLDA